MKRDRVDVLRSEDIENALTRRNFPDAQGVVLRTGGDVAAAMTERDRADRVLVLPSPTQIAFSLVNAPKAHLRVVAAGNHLFAIWAECRAPNHRWMLDRLSD